MGICGVFRSPSIVVEVLLRLPSLVLKVLLHFVAIFECGLTHLLSGVFQLSVEVESGFI
jgi:hypothetical protein